MATQKICAPQGKYLKGYILDNFGGRQRCLIDEYGFVFIAGNYGWSCEFQDQTLYKIKTLPHPVERGNEFDNSQWNWDEWYEKNWQCDSWAWVYSKEAQYIL